jgi:hypothetical protein
VDTGLAGAMIVMQVHAIMRHVLALIVRGVRAGQRPDPEAFCGHRPLPLSHALTLADGALLAGDLVSGCVG